MWKEKFYINNPISKGKLFKINSSGFSVKIILFPKEWAKPISNKAEASTYPLGSQTIKASEFFIEFKWYLSNSKGDKPSSLWKTTNSVILALQSHL